MSTESVRMIDALYKADEGYRVLIAIPEPIKTAWWKRQQCFVEVPVIFWGVVSRHTSDGRSDDFVRPFIRLGANLEDASYLVGFVGILAPNEKASQFLDDVNAKLAEMAQTRKKANAVPTELVN